MNGHDQLREMLARRAELTPDEELRLSSHLADCPECRETAAAYGRQTALLRALPAHDPPAALRAGVLAGINRSPRPRWWQRVRLPAFAPAAAALLAVAGVFAVLNRPHGSPTPAVLSRPSATVTAPRGFSALHPSPSPTRVSPRSAGSRRVRPTATPVAQPSSDGSRQVAIGVAPTAQAYQPAPAYGSQPTGSSPGSVSGTQPTSGPNSGGNIKSAGRPGSSGASPTTKSNGPSGPPAPGGGSTSAPQPTPTSGSSVGPPSVAIQKSTPTPVPAAPPTIAPSPTARPTYVTTSSVDQATATPGVAGAYTPSAPLTPTSTP